MKENRIGFIGTGNFCSAVISGVIGSGYIMPENISVFDIDSDKILQVSTTYRVLGAASAEDVVKTCKYVFLTVKPQNFETVLLGILPFINPDTVIVNPAAGVSISYCKGLLGANCKVIRVMGNTPLLIGKGATAIVNEAPVSDTEFSFVRGAFDACGVTVNVLEEQIDAVIGVSGSAPAFVFKFAQNVISVGVEAGLSQSDATDLFCATLEGSAKMIASSGLSISELIKMVSSPGGTTVAGLEEMEKCDLDGAVSNGVKASIERSKELTK